MKKYAALFMSVIMLMIFSTTAFAAEGNASDLSGIFTESTCINITGIENEEAVTKAWPGSGPAAQISSVSIEQIGFLDVEGHEGNVGILVKVMGHGRDYAKYDNVSVDYFMRDHIILSGTLVDGWYYLYDCGTPVLGDHRFDIKMVSHNYPYTEGTAWATFTIN
ncbi:MAG: hypothetical protein K1W28_08430 [Lachnospiraceae bacterium]